MTDETLLDEYRNEIDRPLVRLFTEYGRRYPLPAGIALGANMVAPLLTLLPAYLLALAIDSLFTRERPFGLPLVPDAWVPAEMADQMLLVFGLLLTVYALNTLLTWAGSWGWALFAEHVQHSLRTDVYDRMQRLGMAFFSDKQTGELMAILSSDVNRLEGFLNGWVGQIVNSVILVVGVLAIMLTINWQLALVTLLQAPLLLLVSYKFVQKVRPKYRKSRSTFGELASRLENNVSGIGVIKSFTTEPFESERVESASRTHMDARWEARRWGVRFGPSLTFITGTGFATVLFVGGWWLLFGPPLFFTGAITVGVIVMFLEYTRQIQAPLTQAGQLLNNYQRVRASAERVFALMDVPETVPEPENPIALGAVDGRVEYDDVSFAYPDGEHALSNADFETEPGEFVGLVGPTGSGKSTIVKLLLRFYDVDSGAIRIDGHDVRDLSLTELRQSIGFVDQNPFLFTGTIRENIAYGMDVSEDELVSAAERACAHEFISNLRDGYDTEVGQGGAKLSGGQRQRIAIARTVLKNPAVVVLDEATSHVDTATEAAIQRSLEGLIQNRTTFAIAHRLSTIRNADTIIVLEDGEVVERGSHEELLDADGLYSMLWRVQAGELVSGSEGPVRKTGRDG